MPMHVRALSSVAAGMWLLCAWVPAQEAAPAGQSVADARRPLAPGEAVSSFVLEPGYRLDLVAAEPLVQDPVAMAFDERGRLFVVEDRGYPDPLEGQPTEAPLGRVALLTDRDGDGVFDHRSEFATGLTYPNGVQPWDGGVFITVAPDLLYLKDSDGDGIADIRRVVLTGFNATRTAQIRFSHPTLGPDGWIYLTSGLNGGRVTSPAHPERAPVEFSTSDSRVHPVTGAFELVGGQGQYGLTFDAEGRRFICANRHPMWQVVLDPAQLARNPHLTFSETVQEVSAVGPDAAVWPLTADLTTASFHPTLMHTPHAGTFTSASGVHIHRGDALPDGHGGSAFIMEPAQNLVQRQVRRPEGVSFRSTPARVGVEFLATTDSWFRPVFATGGPDGALYIADMYRKDIDHPAYVPEESRALFDFTAGRDRGRIYRIAAADRPLAAAPTDLADATPQALVAALADANGWRRETAQRLLVERRSGEATAPLRRALTQANQQARLHALWTLDILGTLEDADVRLALADASAGVRENALRIAERRLTAGDTLLDAVLARHTDPEPRVRLHAALALGARPDARRIDALAAIARRDGDDRWVRAGVLASAGDDTWAFYEAFVGAPADRASTSAAVLADVASIVGTSEPPARALAMLAALTAPARRADDWTHPATTALARGLRTRNLSLTSLVGDDTPPRRAGRDQLTAAMARAATDARSDTVPAAVRLEAIALLAYADWSLAGPVLESLLEPSTAPGEQLAAVRALAERREPSAAAALLTPARWEAYTPQLRSVVLTTLLGDDGLVPVVLTAVERGDVPATSVGDARWRRLAGHRDPAIRTRAEALVGAAAAGDARKAFDRVREPVLRLTGDASHGARVFEQHCAACHTFTSAGGRIGPDLSGIRNQPADALLLHIVIPDHEITPGYEAYTVETRDGRTLFGRLTSEAANGITLRDAAGQDHDVRRADIRTIRAAASSLMPVGLEDAMPAQDLADLLAHLKGR